ncbi:tetratricopeptide repeat protein [Zunongwangia endophytica]|uniref:Tetratricopeptide repeat protein n=1 Tax=Zunongwangia endophytica TaxID=1808945 RepID=A0ABV8H7Y0_9FLAO|nr:tetratricopeptide repeat protein [Zunongwangia endophytica]MDN3595488.1 tetratricopeptide repeat protein [Zunongwangia endophytica]
MRNYLFLIVIFISTSAIAQSNSKIADSLYAVGKYEEAITLMQKEDTSSVRILADLAKYYKANNNDTEALETYQKILNRDSTRVLAALNYGEALLNLGALERADSLFAKLNSRFPKNAQFYYSRGLANERMENDSVALALFSKTQELDTYHQNALYKLAKNRLKNKDYQEAIALASIGLEKKENNVSLHSIIGQTYSTMAVFYEAIPHYEKIIELGQGSEFVHTKLAFAYYKDGNFEKAIENYKQALLYEPGNSSTHYLLGKLYAQTRDFENSELHLLMAIKIKDQPIDAEYFSLALTYKYLEDHKKAFDWFQKTLKENPDNIRAMYERAVAADNYFKDLDTRINYYQAFWNKYYGDDANYLAKDMLYLTKNRISDLKEKRHMEAEKLVAEENNDSLAEVETDTTDLVTKEK